MKKYCWLLIVFSSLLFNNVSYSAGIGLFVPIYSGYSNDDIGNSNLLNWQTDYKAYGLGIVFDTKVAENKLVNYRLNIGLTYQNNVYSGQNYFSGTDYIMSGYDYHNLRFSIDNTIGLGFIRSEFMRVWAGPQFRVGYGYGYGITNSVDYEKFYLALGIAPVIGANFNLGSVLSLCLDLGYRYNLEYGSSDYHYSRLNGNPGELMSDPIYGIDKELFLNISLIFRIHDTFSHGAKSKKR